MPDITIESERLHDSLILVVDDIEMNRRVLTHSLNAHGYHNIITAADGEEALRATHDRKPDLVILDLMMPGMDGFAYCKNIRQLAAFNSMPIIVQTALGEMEQKLKAFEHGANDYICKPVDPGELSARAHIHLNQKLLVENLRDYRRKMTTELETARQMQDRLMPSEHQMQMCGRVFDLKIASHFETSSMLGGDCWGMRPLSDTRLAIYIFDFSGRGMTSAMNVFRMHTIIQELLLAGGEPAQFLARLNQQLYPLLGRDELATMFYGLIDTEANCLAYASAAAPPGSLFPNSGAPLLLQGRGFPLGTIPDAAYETKYIPFAPGDLLLLYSDCITETRDAKGSFMSENELQQDVQSALKRRPSDPARAAVDALLARLREHNNAPVFDDNTISAYWRCIA